MLGLAVLTCVGAIGYATLENMTWLDAFYASIVTISTVGFGDQAPTTGIGKVFASFLIIFGVGTTLYLLSVIAQELLEGQMRDLYQRRSMMKRCSELRGHVIVCGYGRYGQVVVEELRRANRDVVVVESDAGLEPDLAETGLPHIIGTATQDEILEKAGIEHAESLVVAISSEADAVFITLAAHELNGDIRIYARAESDAGVRRLKRAGASYVNSPYQMGGIRTAASILRPSVVDFLELSLPHRSEEIDLEEVRAGSGSQIVGRAIRDIEGSGGRLRIVALKRQAQDIVLIPDASEVVEPDDHLVVIGRRDELADLARDAMGDAS
jgi:voltage-gated potassium channel